MDILETHGAISVPGRGEAEVTLDLYDPPRTDDVLPRGWTAIITSGPDLTVGERGLLFLDAQDRLTANAFVVVASGDRVTRIGAHEPP
ncbi:hypothetical protein [Embleya scabrispora]|jgi:hypothetical protein|uniref:hypothetical protein n=1 Tax=Embleya scabrispora TaxID=159449 RepID=UPI00037A2F62|nr:hypothetical protein [Embleya scabrispora]MYS84901.1 hypothetical protein [Streptomyces sp. SID5474]